MAAALGFGPLVLVGLESGGFFPRTWYVGALGFGAVVLVTLVLGKERVGRDGAALVVVLLALAGWTLLSSSWGIPGTSGPDEALRTLFYASVAAGFVVVVDRSATMGLLAGTLAAIGVLCAYGLAGRALGASPRSAFQGTLLYEPVGYANALGILAATGVLLGVGLVRHSSAARTRFAVVGGVVVCSIALALTESRGAWLALAAGLVILVTVDPATRASLRWAALAGMLVAVAVVAMDGPSVGDRPSYWRVALEGWQEHLLLGSGAGSYGEYWALHRPRDIAVLDAHSLVLESAAELGVVGLVLVLSALTLPVMAGARQRRAPLVPTALAGFGAFVVHSALDWDWEVPATVLPALACAAVLVATDSAAASTRLENSLRPSEDSAEVDNLQPRRLE